MTTVNQNLTLLFGRALLVALFLFSGIGKLMAPSATLTYIAASGAPFPSFGAGGFSLDQLRAQSAVLG